MAPPTFEPRHHPQLVALMHRIVDQMVDNYRPTMEALEEQIDSLEEEAYYGQSNLVRRVLRLKRDLASMRRILIPQRDAVGRLVKRLVADLTLDRHILQEVLRKKSEAGTSARARPLDL